MYTECGQRRMKSNETTEIFQPFRAVIKLDLFCSSGLSGLAAGGLSLVANSFGIELADPEVRGMMAMVLNLGILLGLFPGRCPHRNRRVYINEYTSSAYTLARACNTLNKFFYTNKITILI